jgi:hypothetical protein
VSRGDSSLTVLGDTTRAKRADNETRLTRIETIIEIARPDGRHCVSQGPDKLLRLMPALPGATTTTARFAADAFRPQPKRRKALGPQGSDHATGDPGTPPAGQGL